MLLHFGAMPRSVARSSRVLLRPLAEADAEPVAAACADPEVALFIPIIPSPYSVEDAQSFISDAGRKWEQREEAVFAVEEAASGEFLGVVNITLRDGGSVGYWVKPEARGTGIATEAVRLAVEWVRNAHGIRRLFLTTHPRNTGSQQVAEKAGFRSAGTISHEPPFRDGETLAILFELGEFVEVDD
jgi:RimJ/RimL family protein N-acetyltransferase